MFATSLTLQSQQNLSQEKYYNWFDNQVGIENTGLYNGIRYKELYRVKNGKHKFFESPNFIQGRIIYENQIYNDVQLKYDLFEDQVLINLQTKSGNSIFQLINKFVQSFTLNNKIFVNLSEHKVNNSSTSIQGFYQVSFHGTDLILYKKHSKYRIKHYEKKIVLSEFKNKETYYIYFERSFYLINSKSDLTKLFPNHKKAINNFYSKNRLLLKSNYEMFLIQLSKQISS